MGGDHSKPIDFKDLSWKTKYSVQDLEGFYKSFKTEFPKGKITKPEFIKYYKKVSGGDAGAEAAADTLFSQYDTDGDGKVDFKEYMIAISVETNGTPEEKIKFAFQLYDQDKNGFITEKELKAVLTSMYKAKNVPHAAKKAAEDAKKSLATQDDNKDGKISQEEFIRHAMQTDAGKYL